MNGYFKCVSLIFLIPIVQALAIDPNSIPSSAIDVQKAVAELGSLGTPCIDQNSQAEEPLLCRDAVKAVCEAGSDHAAERKEKLESLQREVVRKTVTAVTKKIGADPYKLATSDIISGKYGDLDAIWFQEFERQTFDALKEFSWSKETVSRIIEKIKQSERTKVRPNDGVDPNKLKIFTDTSLVTSESLEQFSEENRHFILFVWKAACGSDGMAPNALAARGAPYERILKNELTEADPSVFIICPGFLLEAAVDAVGPEKFVLAIGHELGHVIEPDKPVFGTLKITSKSDQRKVAEAESAYQKAVSEAEAECPKLKGCFVRKAIFSDETHFYSCDVNRVMKECDRDIEMLKKRVASVERMGLARQELIDNLTTSTGDSNRDQALLSCLKAHDLDEMNNNEQQIKAFENMARQEKEENRPLSERYQAYEISKLKEAIADFEMKTGRKPDSVDSHQGELIADYWGTTALASILKEFPDQQQRLRVAVANLKVHCRKERTKADDFEEHPPEGYRIRRTLYNPDIRSSVGCKSPPMKPWCDR